MRWNIVVHVVGGRWSVVRGRWPDSPPRSQPAAPATALLFGARTTDDLLPGVDAEQHGAVFDEVLVLDEDLPDDASDAGRDLVIDLHRLDDADGRLGRDRAADGDEGRGAGLLLGVEGAD